MVISTTAPSTTFFRSTNKLLNEEANRAVFFCSCFCLGFVVCLVVDEYKKKKKKKSALFMLLVFVQELQMVLRRLAASHLISRTRILKMTWRTKTWKSEKTRIWRISMTMTMTMKKRTRIVSYLPPCCDDHARAGA